MLPFLHTTDCSPSQLSGLCSESKSPQSLLVLCKRSCDPSLAAPAAPKSRPPPGPSLGSVLAGLRSQVCPLKDGFQLLWSWGLHSLQLGLLLLACSRRASLSWAPNLCSLLQESPETQPGSNFTLNTSQDTYLQELRLATTGHRTGKAGDMRHQSGEALKRGGPQGTLLCGATQDRGPVVGGAQSQSGQHRAVEPNLGVGRRKGSWRHLGGRCH